MTEFQAVHGPYPIAERAQFAHGQCNPDISPSTLVGAADVHALLTADGTLCRFNHPFAVSGLSDIDGAALTDDANTFFAALQQ